MPKPLAEPAACRACWSLLFVLLASIYLITYSARIESGDTRRFFDAVSSFADYGDFYLDQSAWQFPPADIRRPPELSAADAPMSSRCK